MLIFSFESEAFAGSQKRVRAIHEEFRNSEVYSSDPGFVVCIAPNGRPPTPRLQRRRANARTRVRRLHSPSGVPRSPPACHAFLPRIFAWRWHCSCVLRATAFLAASGRPTQRRTRPCTTASAQSVSSQCTGSRAASSRRHKFSEVNIQRYHTVICQGFNFEKFWQGNGARSCPHFFHQRCLNDLLRGKRLSVRARGPMLSVGK
jgi:hypothetical protein